MSLENQGSAGGNSWAKWLGLAVLALTLSACEINEEAVDNTQGNTPTGGNPPGGNPPPPPPPSLPPATDQSIFETTLYPHLVDAANFCAGCHGSNQAPLFAAVDVTTAYNAITSQQKVNLMNPELSRVYVRPKDERHNCGGDAICDRIAADFLTAIQEWANEAVANVPPPTGNNPILSAMSTFADATDGGLARVDDAAIAMFTFSEGAGDVTMDTSGVGAPITLQIEGMEWVEGE